MRRTWGAATGGGLSTSVPQLAGFRISRRGLASIEHNRSKDYFATEGTEESQSFTE
jgi:hypothetical protein